jgi:hypothetical protein
MNQFFLSFLVPVVIELSAEGKYKEYLYITLLEASTWHPNAIPAPSIVSLPSASYPVSESTSSSFLWQFCQIFGFIFVLVMDQLRDPDGEPKDNLTHGLIFQCCAAGVCAILCFLYNGPMKRTEALQAMSNQEVDNLAISKDGQA